MLVCSYVSGMGMWWFSHGHESAAVSYSVSKKVTEWSGCRRMTSNWSQDDQLSTCDQQLIKHPQVDKGLVMLWSVKSRMTCIGQSNRNWPEHGQCLISLMETDQSVDNVWSFWWKLTRAWTMLGQSGVHWPYFGHRRFGLTRPESEQRNFEHDSCNKTWWP